MRWARIIRIGFMILLAAGMFSCKHELEAKEMSTTEKIATIVKKRAETTAYFSGPNSPLSDSAKQTFTSVHFFPVDTNYFIKATYTPITAGPIFTMKATGDIADVYQIAGNLQFKVRDTVCALEVYKNISYEQTEHVTVYFVPFYDKTNGYETYGGGRYLDFSAVTPGDMLIDFNMAYQPYCFYSHEYSCPIPPRVNTLPVAIRAGERK